ncbi:MAG: hypothetical protein A2Y04_02350 [Omnitrophica WOR_2 bacterium GWC2_45_7]|nr:MAG: hypothetical protein A2Y04_02350 [Omnitrophica WOR_2 bacterium GWC2_45_7]
MERWEQMRLFLSECYRLDHAICDRKFFEWQFQADPSDGNASVLCGWENDRLVGILGYLPFSVHWGELGNPYPAVWLLYWMVRKETQRGLGWLLTKRIQEKYTLLLTVNASELGGPFFKKLGWAFFPRVARYTCVFDKKQCVPLLFPSAIESDLDKMIFRPIFPDPDSITEVALNKENYHPDWKLYSGLSFGTVRSLSYLTWRYFKHPVFKYYVILKGEAQRPAVCIYRIEKAFGIYDALVGRIVDFFHPDDKQGKTDGLILMQGVLQYLKNKGCSYVDFICSNRTYSQTFLDLGADEEPNDRQILPVRITPIQHTLRHQNFAFLAPQGGHFPVLENMHITKSDIDGDGPALIPKNDSR